MVSESLTAATLNNPSFTAAGNCRQTGPTGVRVFQKNHDWFICTGGDWDNAVPFVDGYTVGGSAAQLAESLKPWLPNRSSQIAGTSTS
jgi:hypothetical protein